MKKTLLTLLISSCFCILSGCCHVWNHPGNCKWFWYRCDRSFNQCQRDYYDCVICVMDKSNTAPLSEWNIDKCMQKKGYKVVGEHELPKNVKRELAELYWDRGVGFAGCR